MRNNFQFPISNFQINKFNKNGFTLVELLVVIGIITMITALLFPNFMGARQRARDSQRKADLRQIQGSLELYRSDQNPPAYPPNGFFTTSRCFKCWSAGGSGSTCPAGNIYMHKFSCDPGTLNPSPYLYQTGSDTLTYTLTACLENLVDTDRDPTPVAACATPGYASYTVNEP